MAKQVTNTKNNKIGKKGPIQPVVTRPQLIEKTVNVFNFLLFSKEYPGLLVLLLTAFGILAKDVLIDASDAALIEYSFSAQNGNLTGTIFHTRNKKVGHNLKFAIRDKDTSSSTVLFTDLGIIKGQGYTVGNELIKPEVNDSITAEFTLSHTQQGDVFSLKVPYEGKFLEPQLVPILSKNSKDLLKVQNVKDRNWFQSIVDKPWSKTIALIILGIVIGLYIFKLSNPKRKNQLAKKLTIILLLLINNHVCFSQSTQDIFKIYKEYSEKPIVSTISFKVNFKSEEVPFGVYSWFYLRYDCGTTISVVIDPSGDYAKDEIQCYDLPSAPKIIYVKCTNNTGIDRRNQNQKKRSKR